MKKYLMAGAAILALSTSIPAAFAEPDAYPSAEQESTPATDVYEAAPAADAAAQTGPVESIQANPRGSDEPAVTYPDPATANAPVPPSMPADPSYHGGPYKGALSPPPPQAMTKVYPVCTRALQDSCQNPGEGGAPGRSRALGYWPGKPASEIKADSGG